MTANVEAAWAAEELLLSPGPRRDPALLDRLLAPGFHEIGQSGRHWSREEIIAALTRQAPDPRAHIIDERRVEEFGDGLVLLSFRLEFGGRLSRRSSFWQILPGGPRLLFAQGTPIPPGPARAGRSPGSRSG